MNFKVHRDLLFDPNQDYIKRKIFHPFKIHHKKSGVKAKMYLTRVYCSDAATSINHVIYLLHQL